MSMPSGERRRRLSVTTDHSKTCFVIMPFGERTDLQGKTVKFDDIYTYIIGEAVTEAGLTPIRCDEVQESGFIHRKMLEHIRDANVAVVDISLLNANVFYELGIRHTLRRSLTVLIRRTGTSVPFNIANLNVIEYDETDLASVATAKRRIKEFIQNGMREGKNDSLVHEVLELNIGPKAKRLTRRQVYEYGFRDRQTKICVVAGDIQNVKGVDVWVNSENTNMQMARFYDWSVSSVIRYLGATRDVTGHVERTEDDRIANELATIMKGKLSVPAGTVIPTGPGELERSHGVKAVLHAAAVEGEVGAGYRPIENLPGCVTNALAMVDSPAFRARGLKSIIFPLLGAGVGPQKLSDIVRGLFEAAVSYVDANPDTIFERICFLAWSDVELEVCLSALSSFPELGRAGGSR